MTKQFENMNNPAKRFINEPFKENADDTDNTDDKQGAADEETKSKRLNLLVKPSVYEEFKKIATMEQTSVNDLINTVMENVVKTNTDQIELYDKVFGDKDE